MSATAMSPLQRESMVRKPPGTETSASDSYVSEGSMQENLSKLAYSLWEERGCPDGSPEVDWLEAERRLSRVTRTRLALISVLVSRPVSRILHSARPTKFSVTDARHNQIAREETRRCGHEL